jgi:hypothetical protein
VLAAAGVIRTYGIVGDCLNGLTDSLRRQRKNGFTLYTVKANLSGRGGEVVDLARTICGTSGKLS